MHKLMAVFALSVAALSGSAHAGQLWPASVVGSWNTIADQSSLTVTVASQSSTGVCQQITGTILDNTTNITDNLLGYYCPGSGHFSFARTSTNGFTYQFYTGAVSDNGSSVFMGGTFDEVATRKAVGEYSFIGAQTSTNGAAAR